MNLDGLLVFNETKKRTYTADQIILALDGNATGRTEMPASYQTYTTSPTVYFTATDTSGNVLTARTTSGVSLQEGFYVFQQPSVGIDSFIAIWDEGDVSDFVSELVVVDS